MQLFIWQEDDAAPHFPVLHGFLGRWRRKIEVGHIPSDWRTVSDRPEGVAHCGRGYQEPMTRGPLRSWRDRGGRRIHIALPFDDIMEFALALLSVPPGELEELGWSFADRKRLLDHFLKSGKAAQGVARDLLGQTPIALRLPRRDIARLQRFARRALPKAVSNAAMLDRVLRVLDAAA